MKVFISSVISGYEDIRAAAQRAVETLGHTIIRAEDFGASPSSPQVACLDGVRQADLAVLIMGQRYGAVQASGLSATHEEFREAQGRKDIIAFIQNVPAREASQKAFVEEVQDWQGGVFTQPFDGPADLAARVTRAVHHLEVERARAAPDEADIRARATAALPRDPRGYPSSGTALGISIAGGPKQTLLRPSEIEGDDLDHLAFGLAMDRAHPVFVRSEATQRSVEGNVLRLEQQTRSLAIHPDGTLSARVPLETGNMMTLIDESVSDAIALGLNFMDAMLRGIDGTERLRHVCIGVSVLGSSYMAWRTRAEDRRSPNSVTMSRFSDDREPILTPVVPRAGLRTTKSDIAQDLIVLLRWQFR